MRKLFHVVSIIMCLGISSVIFGQTNIDPQADKVLKSINAYMSGLDSLLITANIAEESVYGDIHKLQFSGTLEIGIQHPARFFSIYHADFENRRMYLNDATFTIFDEDVNVYVRVPAAGPLDEVLYRLHANYGINSPGGELFSGNAYELLVESASKVIYVSVSNVNGVACHHIAGTLETMDWQLWVRQEGDPELCRYVVTDRDVPMAPQFSIDFRKWSANAEISDQQFEFNAPADAERIDFVN